MGWEIEEREVGGCEHKVSVWVDDKTEKEDDYEYPEPMKRFVETEEVKNKKVNKELKKIKEENKDLMRDFKLTVNSLKNFHSTIKRNKENIHSFEDYRDYIGWDFVDECIKKSKKDNDELRYDFLWLGFYICQDFLNRDLEIN